MTARRLVLALAVLLGACSQPGLPSPAAPAGDARHTLAAPVAYAPRPATRPGGTVTVGSWSFPTTLSPYLGAQAAATPIDNAIFDGLLATAPNLDWYGDLARDVPTPENGGVRAAGGGMDVTYDLRPGLRWSDGQPLTPDDVVYTYQVITAAGAATGLGQEGYDQISGIDVSGSALVVHFRSVFAGYRGLFSTVLPRHRLGGIAMADLAKDAYWQRPDVVSGPFLVEQATAARISLGRNPHYADGRSGMPFLGHAAYLDRLVFQAFPSRQAVLAALKAGDVQAGIDLTERELPALSRLTDVRVAMTPSLTYEQVSLNDANPNPATKAAPPWADDPAVRQALDLALDRPAVRARLMGLPALTPTPISDLARWAYEPGLPAPAYDLARANAILDADGWAPGADGVRAKNGRRLAFALSTTSDQQLRGMEQDVVASGWRRLGADVQVADFPASSFFGSYEQGGVLAKGGYEAAIWSWIVQPDPDSAVEFLASSSMPAAGRPTALNYSRCHDAAIDRALADGRGTLEQAARGAAYRAFQRAYVQARCELPLYRRLDIGAVAPRLRNFTLNPAPVGNTWNAADWFLG
jgi:peptide/nickel transport system substrate-binding protein